MHALKCQVQKIELDKQSCSPLGNKVGKGKVQVYLKGQTKVQETNLYFRRM